MKGFARLIGPHQRRLQMWTDEPWPWHQASAYFEHRPDIAQQREALQQFMEPLQRDTDG